MDNWVYVCNPKIEIISKQQSSSDKLLLLTLRVYGDYKNEMRWKKNSKIIQFERLIDLYYSNLHTHALIEEKTCLLDLSKYGLKKMDQII